VVLPRLYPRPAGADGWKTLSLAMASKNELVRIAYLKLVRLPPQLRVLADSREWRYSRQTSRSAGTTRALQLVTVSRKMGSNRRLLVDSLVAGGYAFIGQHLSKTVVTKSTYNVLYELLTGAVRKDGTGHRCDDQRVVIDRAKHAFHFNRSGAGSAVHALDDTKGWAERFVHAAGTASGRRSQRCRQLY